MRAFLFDSLFDQKILNFFKIDRFAVFYLRVCCELFKDQLIYSRVFPNQFPFDQAGEKYVLCPVFL